MKQDYKEEEQPVFNAGLGTVMRLHEVLIELNKLYALTSNGLQNMNDISNLNQYFSLIEALYAEGLNEIEETKQKKIEKKFNEIHKINSLSVIERTQKGTKIKFNLKGYWLKRRKCRKVENYIRKSLVHILNPQRKDGELPTPEEEW